MKDAAGSGFTARVATTVEPSCGGGAAIRDYECFTRVEAVVEPYSHTQDLYQAYYRRSIAEYCSVEGISYSEIGSRFPAQLRLLRRVRDSGRFRRLIPEQVGTRVIDGLAGLLGADRAKPDSAVGCYLFHREPAPVRVCIDAHDSKLVTRPDLLEWSDVCFKTNFWPDCAYPAKVAPLANLNPLVLDNAKRLRHLRHSRKELDLFAFFRVWGGADEIEGIEHNLRLLETLARVNCRKKILAYLTSGDIKAAAARLDNAGIPWTTQWMPRGELWRLAACSRLNVVRHGMHQCIPWRLTDILAMGGCPVLDYEATTCWHIPLWEKVHYLNLGFPCRAEGDASFNPDEVVDRVEQWIGSEDLIRHIGRNAATYFDEHLTAAALGRHILSYAAAAVA